MSRYLDDDRGQAIWVGFVLLLTLLLLVLAGYQAFSVPNQNAETEFEHSQQLQGDMIDVSNALVDVRPGAEGAQTQRPVQVRLGTSYRTRVLTINPPAPVGRLQSVDRGPIEFTDATVTGAFEGDPQTALLDEPHDTQLLTYRPSYNEFGGAPTRTSFEHSLLYEQYDTATLSVRDQRTIRGGTQRLNLIAYEGEVSAQSPRTTLDPETLDGPTPPVPIAPDDGETFTLTLPTDAPDHWASAAVIGESFDTGEPEARAIDTDATSVTVELRGQWDLQMARVGFDGGTQDNRLSSIAQVAADEAATANRTYRVRWDRAATAADPAVEYDDATDSLLIDDDAGSVQAAVIVEERATGEPIENATVDPGTTDAGVIDFGAEPVQTDQSGRTTVQLRIGDPGTARLFAASGDAVDSVDASVITDGEGDGSADAVDYAGGLTLRGNGNWLSFDTSVDGSVNITQASVDTTTVGGVRTGLTRIDIAGSESQLSYNSDGTPVAVNEQISGAVSIEFGRFQSDAGNRLPSDSSAYTPRLTEPSGDHIAVTLDFDDGTTFAVYFEYNPP